jgi:cell division septal protein FtsQ
MSQRRKATPARSAVRVKRKSPAAARRRTNAKAGNVVRAAFPLIISLCILVCLGAIAVLGYRSVTASNFFDLALVDVRGTNRASKAEIENIVSSQAARTGVWNADLPAIKSNVEKLSFVRSAAISRVLPDGIRVIVIEREPAAIVRLRSGDRLVDEEGTILGLASETTTDLLFVMTGWDEAKSEKADKENLARIKMYTQMLAAWSQNGLATRVQSVDIADLREPRAITEDSGKLVSIAVGRDNFGEHLKRGIGAIVGKGDIFEGVNLVGSNMILAPRKTK